MRSRQAELPTRIRAAPRDAERDAYEQLLAGRIQSGQSGAAAALWDHFSPLVRGLLVRALGPHHDVEDAMQEIFLRLFQKARALRDASSLRSYVVAVTVHFIRSEFRRRRVRRLLRLTGRDGDVGEVSADAAVNPAARLALRALYRALDRLPADERLAFTLRFFEGAEIAPAAALARVSAATFKRRLAAAKRRLWAMTGEDPFLAPYLATAELTSVKPGGHP
jgi:RNA polymerase sigma-70 factor (ECF subfamily)